MSAFARFGHLKRRIVMARRISLAASILGVAFLVLAELPIQAGGKSDSEVKITASATKPDANGKQTITVTLAPNKGWHTYANPVENGQFANLKTVVALIANGKPLPAKIAYPQGKLTKDKIVGDYKVYDEKTEIKAAVQRDRGDAGPLEVNVTIFACHDTNGVCLPAATVKLTVP
jgi:DsbC/DsbD-like thiol-disulfide interchange protein